MLHAIEESYIILFFYSNDSENSQYQRRELEFSIQNNKTIIPLLIDNIPMIRGITIILTKIK